MLQYTFELDTLQDWYKVDNALLKEAIKSMKEQSQNGFEIIINRKFSNAPTEVLARLKTIDQLNAWILKTFPKRIFYQFANVNRNELDFVLIKSTEPVNSYLVDLKKTYDKKRIIILLEDVANGLPTLRGTEHDINNFSVQEDFNGFDWSSSFLIDRNQPYA